MAEAEKKLQSVMNLAKDDLTVLDDGPSEQF